MKIPKKIRIGGQTIEVSQLNCIDGGKLGECRLGDGFIRIAEHFNGAKQSESSKVNTYWHEVTHCILDTMGRGDLSQDETFVSCFSGFITECYISMEEDWENDNDPKTD